jgi:CheY-like chemotaxis protein
MGSMDDKQTILLADDSPNDLMLMRIAFKKAESNTPIQEVHNGEEAIAYLGGEGQYNDRNKFPLPVVLLLDLNMPMKNGFEVLQWLRTHSQLKRMSVIILTASMRMEDVERAFDLGAHAFLVKPPTVEQLVIMVRRLHDWLEINHFPPVNYLVKR